LSGLSDKDLLTLIESDPEGGIAQVIERYGPMLRGRLRRHARLKRYGNAEIDDVWLEAILRLLDPECRAELRAAGGQILPWLSRWGYWRLDDAAAKNRHVELLADVPAPDPTEDEPADAETKAAKTLRQVFPLLPPRDRMVLRARYGEGLTEREVAERLGISPAAAKKAAHDARGRLKNLMIQAGVKLNDGGDS
jgi:RNA polymerase sigma factor (sigma-70 family)